jgi:hypothetical protein
MTFFIFNITLADLFLQTKFKNMLRGKGTTKIPELQVFHRQEQKKRHSDKICFIAVS